jgi:hypothetical protein
MVISSQSTNPAFRSHGELYKHKSIKTHRHQGDLISFLLFFKINELKLYSLYAVKPIKFLFEFNSTVLPAYSLTSQFSAISHFNNIPEEPQNSLLNPLNRCPWSDRQTDRQTEYICLYRAIYTSLRTFSFKNLSRSIISSISTSDWAGTRVSLNGCEDARGMATISRRWQGNERISKWRSKN